MGKHTPGPWYVTELPEHRKERLRVTDMHDNDLARLCALDVGEDVARANATLIAAAPALLAALQQLVADWDSLENVRPAPQVPDEINDDDHWKAARSAIAKATQK